MARKKWSAQIAEVEALGWECYGSGFKKGQFEMVPETDYGSDYGNGRASGFSDWMIVGPGIDGEFGYGDFDSDEFDTPLGVLKEYTEELGEGFFD